MAEPSIHHHLDPRIKWVWFLPGISIILLIWLVVLLSVLFGTPDAMVFGFSKGVFSLVSLLFCLLFLAGPLYIYHHIEYMSFTYEFGPAEFVIRQGVFTRDTTVIPYGRIQNVNARRTVVERFLGLATLVIDTAGTNPNASEGMLPGVAHKEVVIREIMDRVDAAKRGGAGNGKQAELPSERQLLADILKEIVQLKGSIQSLSGTRTAESGKNHSFGTASFSSFPPSPSGRPKEHKT